MIRCIGLMFLSGYGSTFKNISPSPRTGRRFLLFINHDSARYFQIRNTAMPDFFLCSWGISKIHLTFPIPGVIVYK
jgi:hypothetical protein